MKITKEQVIKAIATEPILKSGAFFNSDKGNKTIHNCEVCVVGAVLRSVIKPSKLNFLSLDIFGEDGGDIVELDQKLGSLVREATFNHQSYVFDGNYDEDFDLIDSIIVLIDGGYYLSALSSTFEHLVNREKKMGDINIRFNLINMVEALFPKSFNVKIESSEAIY